MTAKYIVTVILTGFLVFDGCGERSPKGTQDESVDLSLGQVSIVQPVDSIDKSGLQNLVRNRNGKLLLLNIWATWCLPCVEEFPDLVKLSKSYKQGNLEVVGISVDYVDEIESKIAPFLEKHSVPYEVYVAKFDKEEDFIDAVDSRWNGAIPATFIYDANGKQRYSFIGKRTYSQFKQEVEKLGAKQ